MPRKIAGSVVVITGASTGIGRAAALSFARQGATVVVTARRQGILLELAARCEQLGGKALAIAADVTDQEALHALARRAIETFGRIDVWVNNAAVTLFARFERSPPDAFHRVMETNFFGYVHGARAVLPYFRERGSGVLINVSSAVAKIGSPFISAYAASKSAILAWSDSLRMELRDAPDIRICTVLPAAIDTPLYRHAANFTGRSVKPLTPIYSPEDVAAALVRLVRRPRREVIVGDATKAGAMLHAIAPQWAESAFARKVESEHFQDRGAARSEGNLFEAMTGEDRVSGGWSEDGRKPMRSRKPLFGAALLGTALGWLVVRIVSSGARRAEGDASLFPNVSR